MNSKNTTSTFLTGKKWRSVLSFFLLFLFIVVLPCSIITFYANRQITRKLHHNNENYLSSASVTLDNIFQSCSISADMILQNTSDDFYTLLNADDLSSSETVLASYRFQEMITYLNFNRELFLDAFIYFKNPDLIFTPSGSYDSTTYFSQHRIFQSYSNDYFKELTNTSYTTMFCPPTDIMTLRTDSGTTLYSHAIPVAVNLTGSSPSDAMLVFLLDEMKLNRVLAQLNTAQTSYLYLYDSNFSQILNNPAKQDYAALLELSGQPYETANGISEINRSEDYRILWQKSKVNRLIYICVEPEFLITKQLHSFLTVTLLLVFLVLILCILLYRQVITHWHTALLSVFNHLKQTANHPELALHTPENIDFSTLKNAAEILHQQHLQNRPQLIQAFLIRLFHGDALPSEVESFCKRFEIFPENDFYQILLLKTNYYIWEESHPSDEYAQKFKDFQDFCASFGYVVSSGDNYSFSILLCEREPNKLTNTTDKLVHILEDRIETDLPEVVCIQSSVFHHIVETPLHYQEIQQLLETRGITDEKIIYCLNDTAPLSTLQLLPEHKSNIRSLIEYNPSQCLPYVEKLLCEYRRRNVSFSQYRTIITELLFLLQELLYDYSIPFSSLSFMEESELLLLSRQILTGKRLTEMCLHLYLNFTEELIKKQANNEPAEQLILNYIDEHLNSINLTLLAGALNMNQNYLSQYFKKHFGISFTDYVTKKKIEKAKEMLIHTPMTCKAIGEELGYHDPNVFTRTFKKVESVTPTEYRRKNKSSEI